MTYPQTDHDVEFALATYAPPAELVNALDDARAKIGRADRMVAVFLALREVPGETLGPNGLALLLGAARLVNLRQWYGADMASEALQTLLSRANEI